MAASLKPVRIGTTPAGVEWVCYPRSASETRARFMARCKAMRAEFWRKVGRQLPGKLTQLKAAYRAARMVTMELKGKAARLGVEAMSYPPYAHASDTLDEAREELRRLERLAKTYRRKA